MKTRIEKNDFVGASKDVEDAVAKVVTDSARKVEANIKGLMEGQKSGRQYGRHQASAPGEAPAIDMGQLVGSVAVSDGEGPLEKVIGSSVEYAAVLEVGGGRIARRPAFAPGLDEEVEAFINAVKRAVT